MPPPPPPPPPMGGPMPSKSAAPIPTVDRSALLSQIRGGTALKKATTNDRSAPLIDGKKGHSTTDAAPTRMNGPPGLGGLFAGGVPRLRPVGSSGGGPMQHSAPRPLLPHAASNGPSPAAPSQRHSNTPPARRALPPFPADVAPRGPPPAPPPSNQKPNFSASTSPVQNRVRAGPPLPSKPPGVTRSASQTSLSAKRPPLRAPNVKPPPPPKSPVVAATAAGGNVKFGTMGPQPRLCVPTTGVGRRQSFGAVDTRERENENNVTVPAKVAGPPPPPRNISVPGNLNQVHKARSAPLPPAAPAPPARPPATRPPPPPRGQPPPLPSTGPPQLPQRNAQPPPPPPNQASKPVGLVTPTRPSPTPPQRSSSMRSSIVPPSFEHRFTFNPPGSFPRPCYRPTEGKKYPSKGPKKNHQRQAPPPPVPGLAAQAV